MSEEAVAVAAATDELCLTPLSEAASRFKDLARLILSESRGEEEDNQALAREDLAVLESSRVVPPCLLPSTSRDSYSASRHVSSTSTTSNCRQGQGQGGGAFAEPLLGSVSCSRGRSHPRNRNGWQRQDYVHAEGQLLPPLEAATALYHQPRPSRDPSPLHRQHRHSRYRRLPGGHEAVRGARGDSKKRSLRAGGRRYNLGPNGGILTALNLFTTKFDQVLGHVEKRASTVE